MTPGKRLKILVHEWVTGGGLAGEPLPDSWAAEGGAMRRAIVADFASLGEDAAQVIMTLDERMTDDAPCRDIKVERIGPGTETDRVVALSAAADFTILVAPETDGTLARLTRLIERAGGRILGSSADAIELAASKIRCARKLEELGVPTPEVHMIESGATTPEEFAYPVVVKPDDGAGCMDTYLVTDAESWPDASLISRQAIVQPYVAGVPMSASFLADGRGRAWLVGVGMQEVSVDCGKFAYHGGRLPVGQPAVDKPIRRAVESIAGLRGFVGVDFIKDEYDGAVTILEINPRPTTSFTGLSRLLPPGRLAEAWLNVCGKPSDVDEDLLGGLASWVHAAEPLWFNAMGELCVVRDGGVAR
jgi:tyramine---L-glutamate ligase